MPATLAETIKIANSYALGDPMQPTLMAELTSRYPAQDNAGQFRRNDRQDFRHSNKRREDHPDRRYGSNRVALVDPDQPEAGSSQRQKGGGQPWVGQKKQQWGDKKQWQDRPK
jgi:hypothetical protein